MKIKNEFLAVAAVASLMIGAAGCGNNSSSSNEGTSSTPDATATMGAAEKAGKALDVAGQDVKDSTKEAADKAGAAVDKAGQDVKKGADAAGEEVKGAAKDVSKDTKMAAAPMVLTPKVKNALAMSTDIDASTINVDTLADKQQVVLRGSVPTEAKKTLATQIATKALNEAKSSYKVVNQLTVGAAK